MNLRACIVFWQKNTIFFCLISISILYVFILKESSWSSQPSLFFVSRPNWMRYASYYSSPNIVIYNGPLLTKNRKHSKQRTTPDEEVRIFIAFDSLINRDRCLIIRFLWALGALNLIIIDSFMFTWGCWKSWSWSSCHVCWT